MTRKQHDGPGSGMRSLAPLITALAVGVGLSMLDVYWSRVQAKRTWSAQLDEYARQGAALLGGMTVESAGTAGITGSGAFHPWAGTLLSTDGIHSISCLNTEREVVFTLPTGSESRGDVTLNPESPGFGNATGVVSGETNGTTGLAEITGFPAGTAMGFVMIVGSARPPLIESGYSSGPAFRAVLFLGGSLVIGMGGVLVAGMNRSLALKELILLEHQSPRAWRASLPTRRQDDVGQVARILEKLSSELEAAQGELGSVKREIDARVADRTRQVSAMLQRAEEKAWKDSLTKLGNRRLLEERLESIFESQAAANDDLSIVMIDLDHFKRLNDTCGHAAGDELLAFLGQLLRGTLRPTDIGIRYGGDEFCLLLLGVSAEGAAMAAERIAKLFAQHSATLPVSPKPTLSIGVAARSQSKFQSGSELLAAADAALYAAKRGGRNRVQSCPLAASGSRSRDAVATP